MAGNRGDHPLRTDDYVYPRSEFDQAYTFAGTHLVAGLFPEHDATRNQAGDLTEDDTGAVTLDGDGILLILRGRKLLAGYQEPTFVIVHLCHLSGDRNALHVDVQAIHN